MPITALLVSWKQGWRRVDDTPAISTFGRHEATLSLGTYDNAQDVDRVALRELEHFAQHRQEITLIHEPRVLTKAPFTGYSQGDIITVPLADGSMSQERVLVIEVSEDTEGNLTFRDQLRDTFLD